MERYEKIELIGCGSFGDVSTYRDLESDGKTVAIKRIPFSNEHHGCGQSDVMREISVLKEMDHQSVVRLLDVVVDEEGFHLVFEHLQIDLANFLDSPLITRLDPHLIKYFLFQALEAVSYCHSQKVVHGDLKPANLLLDLKTSTLKLCDFGLARTFEDVPLPNYSMEVSSLQYRAPELLLGGAYSTGIDVWAVGCIFAEMVEKCALFNCRFEDEILIQICRMNDVLDVRDREEACHQISQMETLPSWRALADLVPGLDEEGLDLLSKMLCVNPDRRITAAEALNHPYFEHVQQVSHPYYQQLQLKPCSILLGWS